MQERVAPWRSLPRLMRTWLGLWLALALGLNGLAAASHRVAQANGDPITAAYCGVVSASALQALKALYDETGLIADAGPDVECPQCLTGGAALPAPLMATRPGPAPVPMAALSRAAVSRDLRLPPAVGPPASYS